MFNVFNENVMFDNNIGTTYPYLIFNLIEWI